MKAAPKIKLSKKKKSLQTQVEAQDVNSKKCLKKYYLKRTEINSKFNCEIYLFFINKM